MSSVTSRTYLKFRHRLIRRSLGLISYSEATRYTISKRLEAEVWCEANNKQLAQHTLYPRTKGFIACVQQLRQAPQVKAVYDVTVAYVKDSKSIQAAPSFVQSIILPRLDEIWEFHVHVDRHPIEELPRTDEDLAQWLEDRWLEKGDRIESLRKKME